VINRLENRTGSALKMRLETQMKSTETIRQIIKWAYWGISRRKSAYASQILSMGGP